MIDLKWLRANKESSEAKLKSKDPDIELTEVLALDDRMRAVKTKGEELKSARNHLSQQIGEKKRLKEDTSELMQEVSGLGEEISHLDHEYKSLEEALTEKLASIPNLPFDEIKVSLDP